MLLVLLLKLSEGGGVVGEEEEVSGEVPGLKDVSLNAFTRAPGFCGEKLLCFTGSMSAMI